jgi:hypothetical protein
MSVPSHPQPATSEARWAMLADAVSDHEKRIRKVERVLYAVAGAASGSTGTWITIIMTRR